MSAVWPAGQTGKTFGFATFPPLNLHAAFSLERPARTIEFRAFNGTLHAGKIKAYIQLCLAISAQALTTKAASPTRPVTDNPKYTFYRPSLPFRQRWLRGINASVDCR